MTSLFGEAQLFQIPPVQRPEDPAQAYLIVGADFRQAGRVAEAELVLGEAARRFPGNAAVAIAHADLAQALGDPDEVLRRWQTVRSLAPHVADAWLAPGSILLRQLKRLEEADALLAEGVRNCPDHADLALEFAWCAAVREDRAAAAQRYDAVRHRFPHLPIGHSALVGTLRDLGLFDAADAVAAAALQTFPDDRQLLMAYAWTAQYRRDWPEAVRRWSLVRQHVPDERLGYVMAARTLHTEMRAADQAEAILVAGAARFPDDLEIGREYATIASAHGDLSEALRRWQQLGTRFPNEPSVIGGRGDAEMRWRNAAADATADGVAAAPIPAAATDGGPSPLREFFLQFESIGHNCEFGLVQRHFGAEPLGLLRWNAFTPPHLIAALENNFDGVDTAEDIELQVIRGEYVVADKRYKMAMHTFLMAAEVTIGPERLHAQMCRRMRFLKDKFIEDLSLGQKLLVYRCWETIPDNQLHRLFAALRRYGDNTLLYVRAGAPPDRIGHVERAQPGLLLGDIDRFVNPEEGWDTLSVDAWLAVCRNAHGLWRPPA